MVRPSPGLLKRNLVVLLIRLISLRGSLIVKHRVFYLGAEERPQTQVEVAWRPMVRLPPALRRWHALHWHRQGLEPTLPTAQCRDRLPIYPQPIAGRSR